MDECRSLLAGIQNQNAMLRFVKRSANDITHYLARYNSSIADRMGRMGNVHSEFQYILCKDLN